ncbi:sulfotransferase domain-containing protein [Thalassotalea litorea]|uniref:sulfotransferase domain-containing protein n=1 Tax=Thalassotalea litorea TaxID=2020715 RepID=UPI003734FFD6
MDIKFDFVIAGAQKCGTTSLYHYLSQVEGIQLPTIKEIPYFCNDDLFGNDISFNEYFSELSIDTKDLLGFAYVNVMTFAEKSVRRIGNQKHTKYILMLREPKERIVSAYNYAIQRGWETELEPEKAFCLDRAQNFNEYWEYANLTYVEHSLYGKLVSEMTKQIPADNILCISFNYFKQNPQQATQDVLNFLNANGSISRVEFKIHNKARATRFKSLQKLIMRDNPLKKLYQSVMPRSLKLKLNRMLVRPLEEWNLSSSGNSVASNKEKLLAELDRYDDLFERDAKVFQSLAVRKAGF